MAADHTFTGLTTVQQGRLVVGNGGTTGSIAGDLSIAAGAVVELYRSADYTYAGTISGGGAIQKYAENVATLTGSNSHTGGTFVSTGTLKLGHTDALGSTTGALTVDAMLDLNGFNPVVGRLTGSGTITNVAAAIASLTAGSEFTGSTTFAGTLAEEPGGGALAVIKSGSGTLELSGANTHSGFTFVTAGVLAAKSASALSQNSILSVGGTGTVRLAGFSNAVAGLSGSTGAVVENAATAAATLTVVAATNATFAGVLRDGAGGGPLSLVKDGPYTLTLSAANTYTGTATITNGVLELGDGDVLPAVGAVILNGGTLRTGAAGGFSDAVGPLRLDASSTIALGSGEHDLTFGGLTGVAAGALTITGWVPGGEFGPGAEGRILFTLPLTTAAQANADYAAFLSHVQFSGLALGDAMLISAGVGTYEMTPTPEPATALGLAAAGLGIAGWIRRKRTSEVRGTMSGP